MDGMPSSNHIKLKLSDPRHGSYWLEKWIKKSLFCPPPLTLIYSNATKVPRIRSATTTVVRLLQWLRVSSLRLLWANHARHSKSLSFFLRRPTYLPLPLSPHSMWNSLSFPLPGLIHASIYPSVCSSVRSFVGPCVRLPCSRTCRMLRQGLPSYPYCSSLWMKKHRSHHRRLGPMFPCAFEGAKRQMERTKDGRTDGRLVYCSLSFVFILRPCPFPTQSAQLLPHAEFKSAKFFPSLNSVPVRLLRTFCSCSRTLTRANYSPPNWPNSRASGVCPVSSHTHTYLHQLTIFRAESEFWSSRRLSKRCYAWDGAGKPIDQWLTPYSLMSLLSSFLLVMSSFFFFIILLSLLALSPLCV